MKQFIWRIKTGAYSSGENLCIGRIVVGSVDWNSCHNKGIKGENYIGNCSLPSIKYDRLISDSKDEVKRRVEELVLRWFKET